jgi:hypothetical protein
MRIEAANRRIRVKTSQNEEKRDVFCVIGMGFFGINRGAVYSIAPL